ncbi:hypothetical protein AMTRI_Chr09g33260 [Amborella trichopoda]
MAAGSPLLGCFEEDQSSLASKNHLNTSSANSSSSAGNNPAQKRKRNRPGTPYPNAEVIRLSPEELLATNRFVCEVCEKGFQREQNLQLHRRGHNLPWKLKAKSTKEARKKVYPCPEPTCVHHDDSRALGDLTGIKKHYCRKHGEKKFKCEKCSKKYAVLSDWKAHTKTCGTREYKCDCGTIFSRRDCFLSHRAFCDALAQETSKVPIALNTTGSNLYNSLGLGLSNVGSSISSLLDQNPNGGNNPQIQGLGRNGAPQSFESLISPSNQAFFPSSTIQTSFNENSQNNGLLQNRSPSNSSNGFLQFPQNNTSPSSINMFVPSIFSNGPSNGYYTSDSFNYTTQSDVSSMFSSNFMSDPLGSSVSSLLSQRILGESLFPHMSATSLLQKAEEMGGTSSRIGVSFPPKNANFISGSSGIQTVANLSSGSETMIQKFTDFSSGSEAIQKVTNYSSGKDGFQKVANFSPGSEGIQSAANFSSAAEGFQKVLNFGGGNEGIQKVPNFNGGGQGLQKVSNLSGGSEGLGEQLENNQSHLLELIESFTNGSSSIFGGISGGLMTPPANFGGGYAMGNDEQDSGIGAYSEPNFSTLEQTVQADLHLTLAGDILTRDFLGIGGVATSFQSAISDGLNMASLEAEVKPGMFRGEKLGVRENWSHV